MSDPIYQVDRQTRIPKAVLPVSYRDLGVQERGELQQWILAHPEILGEPLLVVTTEFARFDKSDKRLDVLALDQHANLVVVELKLDAARSLADLQALRYAAFVSTTTGEQIVEMLSEYRAISREEAEMQIRRFLSTDTLPTPNDRPRIILAAGSIEDQELTSLVLWVRKFGIDISCVELTPYRLGERGDLILVPRTIIPVPEAIEYIVKVESKERIVAADALTRAPIREFWKQLREYYNSLNPRFLLTASVAESWIVVSIGVGFVHYQFSILKRKKAIVVSLDFESDDLMVNQKVSAPFGDIVPRLSDELGHTFEIGQFDFTKWIVLRARVPYEGAIPSSDAAKEAAHLMKEFVDATYPTLEKSLRSVRE